MVITSATSLIRDATGDVKVDSGSNVGGLVGYNNASSTYSVIDKSYATGNVIAPQSLYVGGLVGFNAIGPTVISINNSYYEAARAPVEAAPLLAPGVLFNVYGANTVGGLVGLNAGAIDGSHASGIIGGPFVVGGLVGNNGFGNPVFTASLTNSQFNGAVIGVNDGSHAANTNIGGAVGYNRGIISGVDVSGTVNGGTLVGGLVGLNSGFISGTNVGGTVANSHFNGTVTGNDNVTTSSTVGRNDNTDPNVINNNVTGTGSVSTPASRAQAAAAAAAQAAAAQAALARQAGATANAIVSDTQTSALTPPTSDLSAAGTKAVDAVVLPIVDDNLKSIENNIKSEEQHHRRRLAATTEPRTTPAIAAAAIPAPPSAPSTSTASASTCRTARRSRRRRPSHRTDGKAAVPAAGL